LEFRFHLINNRTSEQFEIDEPIGTDGLKPRLKRDAKTHGLTFEFSEQELSFESRAREMISDEYEQYGVDADITFLIEINCNNEWSEFYSGKLDFTTYEKVDGAECFAKLNIGQTGVQMVFKSRQETKVDLESLKTLDGSDMTAYPSLGRRLSIPSKSVLLTNRSAIKEEYKISPLRAPSGNRDAYKMPFGEAEFSEIEEFSPISVFQVVGYYPFEAPLFLNNKSYKGCVSNTFSIKGRFKLEFHSGRAVEDDGYGNIEIDISIYNQDNTLSSQLFYHIQSDRVRPTIVDKMFDLQNVEIQDKKKLVATVITSKLTNITTLFRSYMKVLPDTYFEMQTLNQCTPTDSKVFMLHETLSRVCESITDKQLTVKSNYFGRTNSNVNNQLRDGAAGMRCLTTGLMLRNATYRGEDENREEIVPKFTVSFKDLLDGLIATDAIGIGIEGDKLRVEPWAYFYSDDIIMHCDDVAEITRKVEPSMCFALANIGYAKWEAEEWNGIDGFHGKRQYRTRLKNVDTKLEQYSKLIADGYAIEATRRRGISEPSKDWRYDNDIFIIDLKKVGGGIYVNTGSGDSNTLIDPATVFNVELSPARNAARWFSWIMQGVKPKQGDQLIYASTEGYANARTTSEAERPIMAGSNIPENGNISIDNISTRINNVSNTPKFRPETVEFEYPMTYQEFASIKSNPYGLIEFNGEYGWVKQIECDIFGGMAKFTLIPKAS
jgi:hypothetical protein